MTHVVICDIDGTLADNQHRQHYLEKTPKDWDGFFSELEKDGVIGPVLTTYHALLWSAHPQLLGMLCTGRMEKYREATERWLDRVGVQRHRLLMRATDDFRDDALVKREMLRNLIASGYKPYLAIDDRTRVVKMWRDEGILCLQVADGDF